ncbi:MAG: 1-deoxy-D-xylulose-5-phosphate synthase [Armatimonadetes bacterium]|nr:1-deoxy-D-xylulose-5-phosphate synthase [Armatimonadota bacterium]
MAQILPKIQGPAQLRSLDLPDLNLLCSEIREMIIEVVTKNGGHLAPNLGVVELTVALHRVYNSPKDKIIWDVSHQAYPHKILTGRSDRFHTIRTQGGLSGFASRRESPHDSYGAGHASTSISAGVGFAKARDLQGGNERVVVVIGDGALTGGLAFEGLNNLREYPTDITIVLNDNEMSISRNVGGIAHYLSKLRISPAYQTARKNLHSILDRLPRLSDDHIKFLYSLFDKAEDTLAYMTVPTAKGHIFQEMGLLYVGPVDGHNMRELLETLENVKKIRGPVLVHVRTIKGKGLVQAENDATRFHGVSPNTTLDEIPDKASLESKKPVYTDIFANTLIDLAKENRKIIGITAAMPSGTGLSKFQKEFPNRYFDVGIAENHAVVFAAGLACQGFKPVCAVYSTFLQRAYDPVVHDVCLQNLPVVLALDRGGIVGDDGPTHHGVFDLSFLRSIPNIVVMTPKDENEFRHMLKTAVEHSGPVAVRYPRGSVFGVPLDQELRCLPIGKGEILRKGKDLAIFAVGPMVQTALEAAEKLSDMGVDAAVVNARFVKPLDKDLLLSFAENTRRILTLEENALQGGFGSAVMECLSDAESFGVRVARLGIPDAFLEHGTIKALREQCGLTVGDVVKAAFKLCEERQPTLLAEVQRKRLLRPV